jgi:predicted metal-dependent hydrolase
MQKQKYIHAGINYTLRKSKRAKRMRLTVYCDGNVVVTMPNSFFWGESSAEKIIREKADWILSKIAYFKKFKHQHFFQNSRREFLAQKTAAKDLAERKISEFNKIYNFKFRKINIRNQKTRWGSCSKAGNLNFNYKIALLPERMADYIIVHELCHLGEFNHSSKFWNLVAQTIPDYKNIRREIRGN